MSLGLRRVRSDAYQNLDRGASHFSGQLPLVVENCVGLSPQLSEVDLREGIGDSLDALHIQLVALTKGIRSQNHGVFSIVSPADLASQTSYGDGFPG